MTSTQAPTEQLDAVILGAGVAGLYQLAPARSIASKRRRSMTLRT